MKYQARPTTNISIASIGKQRGVAMIMAMLIVVLVAAIAIEISWRFELSISRSANRWAGVQAKAYMDGAEQLAMEMLRRDLEDEESAEADHLGEAWAEEAPPFPTDHGWIKGTLEDAQGRFNLNLLQPPEGACMNGEQPQNGQQCPQSGDKCELYSSAQMIFYRLLQTVNLAGPEDEQPIYLEPAMAEEILQAVIDWLDADSEITGFGGAESSEYEQMEPPVTIANMRMISVSELQQVKGVTPTLYKGLLPYIIALPVSQQASANTGGNNQNGGDGNGRQSNGGSSGNQQSATAAININTAKPALLRAVRAETKGGFCIEEPLTEEIGQEVANVIRAGEYRSMQDFTDDPMIPDDWKNGNQIAISDIFGVMESQYFLFFGEVGIGDDYVRRGSSLIKRAQGEGGSVIEVVRRTDANF